jgi:hypothetical protein
MPAPDIVIVNGHATSWQRLRELRRQQLEAEQTSTGDLHALHGKVCQKAAWARGLFVSYIGFSEQGLQAFGRGKRVICLDGADLAEAFMRALPLPDVLNRKVRRAAETGPAFVRVRDLF